MDTPQISRSGRVLKKSAKVKEMEDFDINDLEVQGKRPPQAIPKMQHGSAMKPKPDQRRFYQDSSPDGSKESDSSSETSETSSSSTSSDESDGDEPERGRQWYSNVDVKPGTIMSNIQHVPQEKVVVEPYRQRQNSEMSMDVSEDEASDSGLVIAEESNDSLMSRGQKGGMAKKKQPPPKKDPSYSPKKNAPAAKKKAPSKPAAKKGAKQPGKSKPLTAYMLWCIENRKRISASSGAVGFGNIGKKMGEAWQALPDKEKLAWRRKAKKLALKNSGGLISTGPANGTPYASGGSGASASIAPKSATRSVSTSSDDMRSLQEFSRGLGTAAIDSAAYLKLLGDSLSVIGQRLTEHEGQLAVSGIFSVLLDTILCVVGPLLCLTQESPALNSLPQEVSKRTLDSIAYFMPGL